MMRDEEMKIFDVIFKARKSYGKPRIDVVRVEAETAKEAKAIAVNATIEAEFCSADLDLFLAPKAVEVDLSADADCYYVFIDTTAAAEAAEAVGGKAKKYNVFFRATITDNHQTIVVESTSKVRVKEIAISEIAKTGVDVAGRFFYFAPMVTQAQVEVVEAVSACRQLKKYSATFASKKCGAKVVVEVDERSPESARESAYVTLVYDLGLNECDFYAPEIELADAPVERAESSHEMRNSNNQIKKYSVLFMSKASMLSPRAVVFASSAEKAGEAASYELAKVGIDVTNRFFYHDPIVELVGSEGDTL